MRINTYIVNSFSVTRSIEVRNFDVRCYYVLSYTDRMALRGTFHRIPKMTLLYLISVSKFSITR